MNEDAPTPEREEARTSHVSKLAWLLIALGIGLNILALLSFLSARSHRLSPNQEVQECSITFTTPGARPDSAAPLRSVRAEEQKQLPGATVVVFAPASFETQDQTRPTPTRTREADQRRVKSPEEKILAPAKPPSKPPRLVADKYDVVLCRGREQDAQVQLTASGFDPTCPLPTNYSWVADGGRIKGSGPKVVWDLSGMPPGQYRVRFKADKPGFDPNCCRDCELFSSLRVVVHACPSICPKVLLSCPGTVMPGKSMTLAASVTGGTPGVRPDYQWTVSSARGIIQGPGSLIKVDTAGLEGTKLSAIVEVFGYGRVCSASCTPLVPGAATPTPTPTPTPSPTPTQTPTPSPTPTSSPTPKPSPTPTPSPTPAPSPTPSNVEERNIVTIHYPKQLLKGEDATITFEWTRAYQETEEKRNVGLSSTPRVIPASFRRVDAEQPSSALATLTLHSNDLIPKTWTLELPLGEPRSLIVKPANYAERGTFTLEVKALEIDGVLWQRADTGFGFWLKKPHDGGCGARSFVVTILTPPSPYVPPLLLIIGTALLCAGDYLRRHAAMSTLTELEKSMSAPPKEVAAEGDDVRCTVFAPTEARQGKSFMVIAFAHLAEQAALLAEMAKGMSKSVEQRGPGKKLAAKIERGQELLFSLEMPGMEIDEPNQSLIWEGEPDSVQFGVKVPKDFETGGVIATVRVAYNSVPVGHVKFELEIVEGAPQAKEPAAAAAPIEPPAAPVPFDNYVTYRQVFISYASPDRPEVLKRVQALSAMRLSFFQDLLTLEPGDDWEKTIYRYLDQSDAVFLFWSSNAKKSEWVEKELRYALSRKEAAPAIVPIIIETPAPLPPPDYLQSLHFNDKIMYLIKVEEDARRNAAQSGN